jgi:hypothetical protein
MTDRPPALSPWLEGRLASVPVAVRRWMTPRGPMARRRAAPDALASEAREAAARALEGEGDHRGAFDLLAADGLATLACLAALEADDPGAELAGILERLAR